jgi:TolB-like protein/DNA-binding winged helix-turn-helix (wHTH) protein
MRLDRYVIDLDRGCLLLDGSEIVLRPKSYAVLLYLAQHPGRLASKEELFAAVWPKIVVTDDALVQSIGELRRALGGDGRRLIRTVPRRGYRLECEVVHIQAAHPSGWPRWTATRTKHAIGTLLLSFAAIAIWIFWPAGEGIPARTDISGKAAIAVLPFRTHWVEPSRDYFADGFTQDVINALGRFSELTVMSWSAVAPYKDTALSPGEIARRLGVDYQVEGSVIRSGERVTAAAHIVGADGRVLWSARYDGAQADVFALHERITTELAGALAIRVTKLELQKVLARPSDNLEAYDYVLRARYAMQRHTRSDNANARALLRRALEIDASLAASHAGLAETHLADVAMGWTESPSQSLSRAEDYANAALRLDAQDLRAHLVLARIHIFRQQYALALAEVDRTLAINPSSAEALGGRGNVLMWVGRTDDAIESLERAQRIDPDLNAMDRFALSLAYYSKRQYEAAITQAERNLRDAAATNASRMVLAAAYAQGDRPADALRVADTIRTSYPAFDLLAFGSKFLNATDLEHLREGFRKAGLLATMPTSRPAS